jgi:hypothetical protein
MTAYPARRGRTVMNRLARASALRLCLATLLGAAPRASADAASTGPPTTTSPSSSTA